MDHKGQVALERQKPLLRSRSRRSAPGREGVIAPGRREHISQITLLRFPMTRASVVGIGYDWLIIRPLAYKTPTLPLKCWGESNESDFYFLKGLYDGRRRSTCAFLWMYWAFFWIILQTIPIKGGGLLGRMVFARG